MRQLLGLSVEELNFLSLFFETARYSLKQRIFTSFFYCSQVDQLRWVYLRTILLCFGQLSLQQNLIAKIALNHRLCFPGHRFFAYCLSNWFQVYLFWGLLDRWLVLRTNGNHACPVALGIPFHLAASVSKFTFKSHHGVTCV